MSNYRLNLPSDLSNLVLDYSVGPASYQRGKFSESLPLIRRMKPLIERNHSFKGIMDLYARLGYVPERLMRSSEYWNGELASRPPDQDWVDTVHSYLEYIEPVGGRCPIHPPI